MKKITHIFIFIFITQTLLSQINGDEWNHRVVSSYTNDEEVARVSLTFLPGFSTEGHSYFRGYIDPNLPLNGGNPVSNGVFDLNYIRVYKPLGNNMTQNLPQHESLDYELWSENITYFDGLGREVQNVSVKASGYGNDIIKPIIYDNFGRIETNYLAYAIAQSGTNGPGGYRSESTLESQTYHSNYFGDEDGNFAFYKKEFDGSPLNRTKKQSSAGYDWRMEGGEVKEYEYKANVDNEVVLFEVNDLGKLVKNGYHAENTLFSNSFIDEEDNEVTQFTNSIGQVLLKKGEENTKTYYVYDDFGLLRYVIPPLAADAFEEANGTIGDITNETINTLCYYYEYDNKKRMILKKIPGASESFIVYNHRDQIVLTQNGVQRQNNLWFFTKYDALNRTIITGIYNHGVEISQEGMQSNIDQNNYFETYNNSTSYGYSNSIFPILDNDDEIYTINYFDDYDALQLEFDPLDYQFCDSEIEFYFPKSMLIKGLPTISKTKVLVNDGEIINDDWLLSVNYYDKYGHLIQTITDNHLGGKDIVSSRINFTGDIVESRQKHVANLQEINLRQRFEYDNAKRLIQAEHKINNQDWIVLNKSKYNESGQISQKQLHGVNNVFIQTLDYRYNIKGWLTDMNKPGNLQDDLFAIRFEYNTDNQYSILNGNISQMSWSSNMFPDMKQYSFVYDGLNRLTDAFYSDNDDFKTHYQYDMNGNIEHLTRNCLLQSGIEEIDNLSYEYIGNQLKSVNDGIGLHYENNGFKDNGVFLETEYFYDQNGNMNMDLNKGIESITYNHINLPQEISFDLAENKKINYTYTANGIKLRKQTHENGSDAEKTDYSGSFVYENEVLSYIITPEGRLMLNDFDNFEYHYFLKDHLGNTRVTFSEDGEVLQDNNYYPFGMSMGDMLTYQIGDNISENYYLYNGKEIQYDFGLDWYDYGARMYDPELGRFHTVDPLSEKFLFQSTYTYASNNPINFIDFMGMSTYKWEQSQGKYMKESQASGWTCDLVAQGNYGSSAIIWGENSIYANNTNNESSDTQSSGGDNNSEKGNQNSSKVKGPSFSNNLKSFGSEVIGSSLAKSVDSYNNNKDNTKNSLILIGISLSSKYVENATKIFQISNVEIYRAALRNKFPTLRLNGIMSRASSIMNFTKSVGRGTVFVGSMMSVFEGGVAAYNGDINGVNKAALDFSVGIGTATMIGGVAGVALYGAYMIIMQPPPGNPHGLRPAVNAADNTNFAKPLINDKKYK